MRSSKKCPICNAAMKRLYEKCTDPDTHKIFWVGAAWVCSNPACKQIVQDADL